METKQKKKLFIGICIYVAVFLAIFAISNLAALNDLIHNILRIFRPLLIGLVIAYFCNPFFRFFERKPFFKIQPASLRRCIALIFTYLLLFLILGVLVMLIVPQLVDSIVNFINGAENYFDRTIEELNALIRTINEGIANAAENEGGIPLLNAEALKQKIAIFFRSIRFDSKILIDILTADTLQVIMGFANDTIALFTDLVFGLFISIYFLYTKEKRYAQIMLFRRAVFPEKVNAIITKICTTTDKSFGGFIRGKLMDSGMVGVLVYIAISLIGVPYAILIAAIVAITDIIPVIGPFIGVIPSAVIILLTDPSKVIPFLLCILIIQQFDGNIMAPKILGENTGVSSLCVMIAITTMGGLWGLVGMLMGVPLFATVLELTGEYLDFRLKKKGVDACESYYYEETPPPAEQTESQTLFARIRQKRQQRLERECIGGIGDLTPTEQLRLNLYRKKLHQTEEATDVNIQENTDRSENIAEESVAEHISESNEKDKNSETETKEAP